MTATHTPTMTASLTATDTPTPTPTLTPTATLTPSATATLTLTFTLTATATPTATATTYSATISGLRALLRNLRQQGEVSAPSYRALDALLRSAERQLQSGHSQVALVELRAFIRVVRAHTDHHLTADAAHQLVSLARQVIETLR